MDVVFHGEEAYATGEGALLVLPELAREADKKAVAEKA